MELPITPTFFKRLDIFQKLMDFEKDEEIKSTWKAEKIVLVWAAGADHQHIGSYIDPSHVTKPLENEIGTGKLDERSVEYAVHPQEVLDALIVRGFADKNPNNKSVLINKDGLMAGKIIKETKYLKSNQKYWFWISLWWIVLGVGFLALVAELISTTLTIARSALLSHVQSQTKTNDVSPTATPFEYVVMPDGKG